LPIFERLTLGGNTASAASTCGRSARPSRSRCGARAGTRACSSMLST
jgi:hypothetical protein